MIAETVLKLVDGNKMTDSAGYTVEPDDLYGKAAEVSGENFYFREQPPYCDEAMAAVMGATGKDEILKVEK